METSNSIESTDIFTEHARLISPKFSKEEIAEAVRPVAASFHRFITEELPYGTYARQSSLVDGNGEIVDFREFDLDFNDPTENVFTYTANEGNLYFRVPYDYAKNPEKSESQQHTKYFSSITNKQHNETVAKAYRKLAPRMESEYPTYRTRIHRITSMVSEIEAARSGPLMLVGHAWVVDGDNKLIKPTGSQCDIVVANSIAVDLRTGRLVLRGLL